MSTAQKRALIGLGLLALLIVAMLAWGLMRPPCTDCDEHHYRPGAAMNALGSLLTMGRKPVLPPGRHRFTRDARLELELPGWDDDTMRTLKLRRLPEGVALGLTLVQQPAELAKQAKCTSLPRDGGDSADCKSLSFAVTHGGGRLIATCAVGTCEIEIVE